MQVFARGLVELKPGAVETVLSLIEANNLYRGEEHKPAVVQFYDGAAGILRQERRSGQHLRVGERRQPGGALPQHRDRHPCARPRPRVRTSSMRSRASRRRSRRQNYKRTTAVITPGMVKKAMETIETLGLEPALERRFAVIGDISVNDVKWVDGAVKPPMKGGIGDVLMQQAVAASPKHTGTTRSAPRTSVSTTS